MFEISLNGQRHTLAESISVRQLLSDLGYETPRGLAVEINREVVPSVQHAERRLQADDAVEITTLVGGGSPEPAPPPDSDLRIGRFRFTSRLITGTGKYANYDL